MKCKYCGFSSVDTKDGLILMYYHVGITHPERVNAGDGCIQ